MLIALCVVAVLISPSFTRIDNILDVARQMAMYGLISIGQTFVILGGGIDLSVGSIIALASTVSAQMLAAGWPVWVVVVLGISIGIVFGAVNGIGITVFRLPPFIMTLGTMVMGQGLALTISNGYLVDIGERAEEFSFLGLGRAFGVPNPVWIMLAVAIAAFLALKFTTFGRALYGVGSNAEAARLAGIGVKRTIFATYVISGALAGLTALVFVSRLTVGDPTFGKGMELEAIAVVVIGGTSLFGGEGGVVGTLIGAAIVAVLANILNLIGVSPFAQPIVKGAIILIAVLAEVFQRSRRR
ncbi:MAG: ABC transporter permease [Candidatus Kaistia colombiensis]|nr:MAG: ABC transporter permease [Kaistia sp.]